MIPKRQKNKALKIKLIVCIAFVMMGGICLVVAMVFDDEIGFEMQATVLFPMIVMGIIAGSYAACLSTLHFFDSFDPTV